MESFGYIYFGVWAALAIADLYLLFGTKNAKLKRILFPLLVIFAGVWVLLFIVFLGFPRHVLYIAIPSVILITILNLKLTKFCDACGSVVRGEFFSVPKQCNNCGAKLRGK